MGSRSLCVFARIFDRLRFRLAWPLAQVGSCLPIHRIFSSDQIGLGGSRKVRTCLPIPPSYSVAAISPLLAGAKVSTCP